MKNLVVDLVKGLLDRAVELRSNDIVMLFA